MTAKTAGKPKRAGPGRLSAEATEQLPDRLLDAALKEFSQRGFSETTMDQIAKAAGASTKTIYARYANKNDILKAVVKRIADRTVEVHKRTAPLNADDADPRKFLIGLCTQICVRISSEASGLDRFAMSEAYRTPEIRRLHQESTAHGADLIQQALDVWRAKGLLPLLTLSDIKRASVLCLSMATDWTRISTSLGTSPSRSEIDNYVAFAIDHFLRGCGYQPESKPHRRT